MRGVLYTPQSQKEEAVAKKRSRTERSESEMGIKGRRGQYNLSVKMCKTWFESQRILYGILIQF